METKYFQKWSEDYCLTFGLDRPQDLQMVTRWREFFENSGFTIEELYAARAIVGANPPKWRSEHLDAINRGVRENRLARIAAQRKIEDEKEDADKCQTCKGTGWAIVPHPSTLEDFQWQPGRMGVYYTAAVTCSCSKGMRYHDEALRGAVEQDERKRVKIPMTLAEFEKRCIGWQGQLERRSEMERQMRIANGDAQNFDRLFGPVLKRLKG
jgi:hypothetical protein